MAFPQRLGILHVRLAAAVRDAVLSPAADGDNLTKADRETYINAAFQKYASLIYNRYRNDIDVLDSVFAEMLSLGTAYITSPGIISGSGLPSDYGFLIKLSPREVGRYATLAPVEEWIDIKNGLIAYKVPSEANQYYYNAGSYISILPSTLASGTYDIAYYRLPKNLTYTDGAEDIPLSEIHFNSILSFALSNYHLDAQEFEIASLRNADGYAFAPIQLGEPNGKHKGS